MQACKQYCKNLGSTRSKHSFKFCEQIEQKLKFCEHLKILMDHSSPLDDTFQNQSVKPHLRTRAKKIGTACQIFGNVLTILRHSTPNFRRVNVSVPHEMWHQCSKFYGCRDYLVKVVSAQVNEARCQKFGVPCRFFQCV